MRTRLDTDLETIQRQAQLRRIGRDLHEQASAISNQTVAAIAAVVTRLVGGTEYGAFIGEGFEAAMVLEATTRHLTRLSDH